MKHIMPLTYKPKIAAVFNKECKQTTRMGWKVTQGDWILFHEWTGVPYRTPWGRRLEVSCESAVNVDLHDWGIRFPCYFNMVHGVDKLLWPGVCLPWNSAMMDVLARHDGIQPGTGLEFKNVLLDLNGLDSFNGEQAQFITWR